MSDSLLGNKNIRNLQQCPFFLGMEGFNIRGVAHSPDRSQSEGKSLFSKTLYMGVEISKYSLYGIFSWILIHPQLADLILVKSNLIFIVYLLLGMAH